MKALDPDWIRIRIGSGFGSVFSLKCWIRFRMKWMRIRNPGSENPINENFSHLHPLIVTAVCLGALCAVREAETWRGRAAARPSTSSPPTPGTRTRSSAVTSSSTPPPPLLLRGILHSSSPCMFWKKISVADPGSGAFLTPGSGIRNSFFRIPDPKPIYLRA